MLKLELLLPPLVRLLLSARLSLRLPYDLLLPRRLPHSAAVAAGTPVALHRHATSDAHAAAAAASSRHSPAVVVTILSASAATAAASAAAPAA